MDQDNSGKVTLQIWTGHTPCHHPAGYEVKNVTESKPEDLSHIYFKSECDQPWKIFNMN